VRFFALFWQLLSVLALFALTFRETGKAWAAALAGCLYACLSVSALHARPGRQHRAFRQPALILAVSALSYGSETGHAAAAGIFIGIAGLAKQSALPAASFLPLALQGDWRSRLRRLEPAAWAPCFPGRFACLASPVAGAAPDFWGCVVGYNLAYAGQGLKNQAGNLAAAGFTLGKEDWPLWLALGLAAYGTLKGLMAGRSAALAGPGWGPFFLARHSAAGTTRITSAPGGARLPARRALGVDAGKALDPDRASRGLRPGFCREECPALGGRRRGCPQPKALWPAQFRPGSPGRPRPCA